eukprot:PLAT11596.26.p1 GENE.PLAT11596.26~~PLAT11596.26.p1  ORF type:complete len:1497 (+),score=952.09 PLAT11596.26:361-4491(+)
MRAVNTLSKSSIVEVKSMKKPPRGVRLVMAAVAIMMGVAPVKVIAADGRTKVDDYWEPAKKKLLSDSRFLAKLRAYDKDNIPEDVIAKLEPYLEKPEFEARVVARSSKAAERLCRWVRAMVKYDRVAKVVRPKRLHLQEAKENLQAAEQTLAEKKAELQECFDLLAKVSAEYEEANLKKQELEKEVDECWTKLDRAQRLISGLGGEKDRWTNASMELGEQYDNLVGDILLSAGVVAYLGAFTSSYRASCVREWEGRLRDHNIPSSSTFSLRTTLGEQVAIRGWMLDGLPPDSFSINNAIMLTNSTRWPLMIDPQGQANRWIRNMEADHNLQVVRQSSLHFLRNVESAIQFGFPVLLEGVGEVLDPVLEPLLSKQVYKSGGVTMIKLGDSMLQYDERFRLYLTTHLSNPHYSPETCVKVNLLNFMATAEGLEDQFLGIVVAKVEPALEEQRMELVAESARNKKQLSEIYDTILELLSSAEGNILEDEVLINTLSQSKVTSNKIEQRVAEMERTQIRIESVRQGYQAVAFRAQLLYFCVADMASVDPMYQFSLSWFIDLYLLAIDKSPPGPKSDPSVRLTKLVSTLTYLLYQSVCRCLFEKDKLLFSFLLTIKLLQGGGEVDAAEWYFLLTGGVAMDNPHPNPAPRWLTDKAWGELCRLSELPAFAGLREGFEPARDSWKAVYDSADPQHARLPGAWQRKLSIFQRILVLRCIRPDRVVLAVTDFVIEKMGMQFVTPPPFDLKACYSDSSVISPLVFILSPGSDPMAGLLKFADGRDAEVRSISLGQGQGTIAAKMIEEAKGKGAWVLLQNCHLARSWMPALEKIVNDLQDRSGRVVHSDFRLFLTSFPAPYFPAAVLQNGVKLTTEPPRGVRNNVRRSYELLLEEEEWESCPLPRAWKKLAFGVSFFHALVQERRKFGPLGWNIQYGFNDSDLEASLSVLRDLLSTAAGEVAESKEGEAAGAADMLPAALVSAVPWDALLYTTGEINYGGRVTDEWDRRCLLSILNRFYTPDVLRDGYAVCGDARYTVPAAGAFEEHTAFIDSLPSDDRPELFGMHDNASISYQRQEVARLLGTILSIQPAVGTAAGGAGKDGVVLELARGILSSLPQPLSKAGAAASTFVRDDKGIMDSLSTVLSQEMVKFNRLLAVMRDSLNDLKRAIRGLVVMSDSLERMYQSFVNGTVPELWEEAAYPSLRPLGAWVKDMLSRVRFLRGWLTSGRPHAYPIASFFFPQGFLTGALQNHARKYQTPINLLEYRFTVLPPTEPDDLLPPEDGVIVYGMQLEGARWDEHAGQLAEALPRQSYAPMPPVHLLPHRDARSKGAVYRCPVYKTSVRAGQLSTTGLSTNFVIAMSLPIDDSRSADFWVLQGVALLLEAFE